MSNVFGFVVIGALVGALAWVCHSRPRLDDQPYIGSEPTSDPIAVMADIGITQLENYLRQEADQ